MRIQALKFNIFADALIPVLAGSLLLISACNKDNVIKEPQVSNYFPVNTGHEIIYDVELITKSNFTGLWDSSFYQVKEVIAGTYLDNENRETQRIERYMMNDTTPNWTIYNVWAANRFSTKAQRVEDNIRYVKLNFATYKGMEWNGNAENTLPPWFYYYSSMDVPCTLGSLSFDSTCTVMQFADTNLIKSVRYMETFAKGVGMIFKENKEIYYKPCPGVLGCFEIDHAYIYREKAISFIK